MPVFLRSCGFIVSCLLLLGGCSTVDDHVEKPHRVQVDQSLNNRLLVTGSGQGVLPDGLDSTGFSIAWWRETDKRNLLSFQRNQAQHLRLGLFLQQVIVPMPAGNIYAIDKYDGSDVWQINLKESISTGIIQDQRYLYIGTTKGHVVVLEGLTGAEVWRKQLTTSIANIKPIKDAVLVETADGRVYKLSLIDGQQQWVFVDQAPTKLSILGKNALFVVDDTIVLGTDTGAVILLDNNTGKVLNRVVVAQPQGYSDLESIVDVQGTFLSVGDVIYASVWNNPWFAFDWKRRQILWQRDEFIFQPMHYLKQGLLAQSFYGQLYLFDPVGGQSLWKQEALSGLQLSAILRHKDKWVVSDNLGRIIWFSAEDGRLLARYLSSSPWAIQAVSDDEGYLFYLNQQGHIVAIYADDSDAG